MEETKYSQIDLFTGQAVIQIPTAKEAKKRNYDRYHLTSLRNTNKLVGTSESQLWTAFHKLAGFIYDNGEWSWLTYQGAAQYLYPFLGFKLPTKPEGVLADTTKFVKSVKTLSYEDVKDTYFHASNDSKYSYTFKYVMNKNDRMNHYLILSSDYKQLWHSGTIYYLKHDRQSDFTFVSKSILIGAYQILKDLLKEFRNTKGLDYWTVFNIIKGLISGPRSQGHLLYNKYVLQSQSFSADSLELFKHYSRLASTDLSFDYNSSYRSKKFVSDYILRVINEILMLKAENDNATNAITNPATTKELSFGLLNHVMQSDLNYYFSNITLNDSFEIKEFKRFEKSALQLLSVLPKGKAKPKFEFRHLKNKGSVYIQFANQIDLDLNPKNVGVKRVDGCSKFLHEYGHYLDYNLGSDNMHPLSMSAEFKPILDSVRDYVNKTNLLHDVAKMNALTPTEVFARSLELYLLDLGLANNAMGKSYDYEDSKYLVIKNSSINLVKDYFSKKFPEINTAAVEKVEKSKL